jgi:hypothetical protein
MFNAGLLALSMKEKGGYFWFVCGALLYASIILSLEAI